MSVLLSPIPQRGWGSCKTALGMTVKVLQLNCHNAHQAMTELRLKMIKHSNIIALVQEPYINNKKSLANLPKGYVSFPGDKEGRKRSCIIASKHLNLTEIAELCTNTTTVVGGILGTQRVVFCSAYMHYDHEVISQDIKAVLAYCKKNNFGLIFGADSNAHSTLRGPEPKRPCKRGDLLEQWIIQELSLIHI